MYTQYVCILLYILRKKILELEFEATNVIYDGKIDILRWIILQT